ncbi:hypothetical protein F4777DRAFT_261701 [Nemania sp. FL0916]|nr:hypothetical protein F4777DRAFT_261701 [Nemania sp. FL0916]
MTSLDSFSLFPLLPTELRLYIWRQLTCYARIVEVDYNLTEHHYTTTAPTPAILHACHESRDEALRIFKRLSDCPSETPTIYFPPKIDIVYVSSRLEDRYLIRIVAIG